MIFCSAPGNSGAINRHKSGSNFAKYSDEQIKSGYPQFTHTVKMLESHYGRNTLEVAAFSRKAFHQGDLISDFLVRTGLDTIIQPKPTSNMENKSLNPLVCDYLAQTPGIYESVHDNHPKTDLEKYEPSEPWLFEPRKDYLVESQRRSILNHFEAENRNLHAVYFPYVSFESLFRAGTSKHGQEQEQSPKSLEKQQLDFLDYWVEEWLRTRNTRLFKILKTRTIHTIRRYVSRSQ